MNEIFEAHKKNLQQMLLRKKTNTNYIAVKKNELQAHERRVKREEFRIIKDQQEAMNAASPEDKKNLYGNVEKREADLFSRKENDALYQQYKKAQENTAADIQELELEHDLNRQEEKYLFKEIELEMALINFEAAKLKAGVPQ